jgi:D-arabinose 1-dehydrogenase-like Zn-dependent alcohol dehydrogenase
LERATSGLGSGETVAIIGIGGLGYLGVQFAKALGFRAIAVDSRPAGCELASQIKSKHLQPDLVVNSSDPDAASRAIYDLTNGEGVAAAIVCTDSIAANQWALKLLRVEGTLGVLGLPVEAWRFDADVIVFKELSIRGSYVASRDATERMLKTVESAGVSSHITAIPYEQIPEIVTMYENESFSGRLVVQFVENE